MNRTSSVPAAVLLIGFTMAAYAGEPVSKASTGPADRRTAASPVTKSAVTLTAAETTIPGAVRGRPSRNSVHSLDRKVRELKRKVQSLRAGVAKSGWNSAGPASTTKSLRAAVAGLARDVAAFQGSNRAGNVETGRRLANELQQELNRINAADRTLASARDAGAANGALLQISASLDKMIKTIETLPPCCTEGICCHVGFR